MTGTENTQQHEAREKEKKTGELKRPRVVARSSCLWRPEAGARGKRPAAFRKTTIARQHIANSIPKRRMWATKTASPHRGSNQISPCVVCGCCLRGPFRVSTDTVRIVRVAWTGYHSVYKSDLHSALPNETVTLYSFHTGSSSHGPWNAFASNCNHESTEHRPTSRGDERRKRAKTAVSSKKTRMLYTSSSPFFA